MSLCPTSCTPEDLLANPTGSCSTNFRRTTPSRIFFYTCQTPLPNPITNAAMLALFNSGAIVASVELANIVFEQPTFESLQISDCRPPSQIVATRTITFEDRTAIEDNTNSPSSFNSYADYDFWLDKINNTENLNYMISYCNGDVKIPEGTFATLSGFIDYIKATQAGGASTETKKFTLTFQGDPIGFDIKPSFNWIEAGISL